MWYLALMYVSMQMIIILVKTLIEAFLDEASRNAAKQHICPRILHFFQIYSDSIQMTIQYFNILTISGHNFANCMVIFHKS